MAEFKFSRPPVDSSDQPPAKPMTAEEIEAAEAKPYRQQREDPNDSIGQVGFPIEDIRAFKASFRDEGPQETPPAPAEQPAPEPAPEPAEG